MSIFENDGTTTSTILSRNFFLQQKSIICQSSRIPWPEHPSVQEDVPSSIMEELQKMPSAKPAGAAYYATLNTQLFTKFCKDVVTAMVEKSQDPQSVMVFLETKIDFIFQFFTKPADEKSSVGFLYYLSNLSSKYNFENKF